MSLGKDRIKEYLLVSDFDQTLSFNDSGIVLSELLGVSDFQERIRGLSEIHKVQHGGELAYLLLHDPDYRRVRKEHLIEVGKRIRLKQNIRLLSRLLQGVDGHRFSFYVVSAAPEEVIQSALEGIVPHDRIVYVGDGSSDVHVMLHVNRLGGLTIAVSENKYITQIARRTILSDDALSVLIPILEDIAEWNTPTIRALFESHGFVLREWDKVRTDSLTICEAVA